MSPQLNISKLLQIQSAMWDSTIVSIVLKENVSPALGCKGHNYSSSVREMDGSCLTLTGCSPVISFIVVVRVVNCLRWMLLENARPH